MDLLNGIDHIVIATPDLPLATALWQRLGFTLTPPGHHVGQSTMDRCIMFPHGYLELVAAPNRPPGPHALAYGTDHPGEIHNRMGGDGPMEVVRQIENGPSLRFILLRPPVDALPGPPALVCQPETPADLRPAAWMTHANTVEGLEAVTIAVPDPDAARTAWRQIPGVRTANGGGAARVALGNHTLRFVPGPAAIRQIDLRAANVATAAGILAAANIPHRHLDDTVILAAADTGGVDIRIHGG